MQLSSEEVNSIRQLLMKSGLLNSFVQGGFDVFVSGLMRKTFPAGMKILVEGDANDFVYLIKNGEVSVHIQRKGIEVPVRNLAQGDFFGEIGVITHTNRNATITAKTPVEVYMMFKEDFRKLLNSNPLLGGHFQKIAQLRARETKQFAALVSFFGVIKKILFKKIYVRLRKGTVKDFSKLVRKSERIVVLTGAGVSKDSGFSEIHGKGGVWDRFQPVSFEELTGSYGKQKEYWKRKKEFMAIMARAKPNLSHQAIAQAEKTGKLVGVITQNIDGLHQIAGTSTDKVLELNGTNREIECLICHASQTWESVHKELEKGAEVPACPHCGGTVKPKTVSIGQELNQDVLFKAISWAKSCDLLVAVGSSLKSEHANTIIRTAKQSGAKFVIINLSETLFDSDADLLLNLPAGDALPAAFVS